MEIIFFFLWTKIQLKNPRSLLNSLPPSFQTPNRWARQRGERWGWGCHCDGETTKGTKAKKAAKGELSSPCCMSHAVSDAFLLACIEKRQRWVYEPVDESGSTSNYWDAPIVMTLFDGYMSHIISGGEGSAAVLAKAPKKRPLQMMSEREADEMATHGEVLRWSPELH